MNVNCRNTLQGRQAQMTLTVCNFASDLQTRWHAYQESMKWSGLSACLANSDLSVHYIFSYPWACLPTWT